MQELKKALQRLYRDNTKHSNYQNVPHFVREKLGYREDINEEWRGDTARYGYLLQSQEFPPRSIVGDIGANTGFFSLSLCEAYRDAQFIAYESNVNHSDFIWLVKTYFSLDNLRIKRLMVDLDGIAMIDHHDLLLCLNVLHHAGHDFDREQCGSIEEFEEYAQEYLTRLGTKTKRLVFQMGSNWGGDKTMPIIDRDDDAGKAFYLARLFLSSGWRIEKIAYARRRDQNAIIYQDLPDDLVRMIEETGGRKKISPVIKFVEGYQLSEFIGEFYRRPILVCQSEQARGEEEDQ